MDRDRSPVGEDLAQGIHDCTMFTTVVIASFASDALLHNFSWLGVNVLAPPLLTAVGIALILFLIRRQQPEAPTIREA